ncbi:MAG: CopG family transcriptional regulator [Acidimicrobiales bacterium]
MRRFQMMIDDELDGALESRAAQEGVSKAELLREYARERLLGQPLVATDPVWALMGSVSGPDDYSDLAGPVSENVNEALYGR